MVGQRKRIRAQDFLPDVTPPLTPRQLQILKLIEEYRSSNGYSPTMQELAGIVRISKVTIFEHVETLVQKKLLDRQPNKARSLMLSPQARRLLGARQAKCEGKREASKRGGPAGEAGKGGYPFLGWIAAGQPLDAVENRETLDLGGLFASSREVFVLKVRGDSMIGEQIRDGDYVLIEKRQTARNGEIVVALLESGEATLKKFYQERDGVRLEAANPDYRPICVESVRIQGVLKGVVRCC